MHEQARNDSGNTDTGTRKGTREKVYFVPGKLCVVVATNTSPRAGAVFYNEVYGEVQKFLNGAITVPSAPAPAGKSGEHFDLVRGTPGGDAAFALAAVTGGRFERDLALSAQTWQGIRPDANGLFQPLPQAKRPPFVMLEPTAGSRRVRPLLPLTMLQFHDIRLVGDREITRERHVAVVRELVNLVNRRFGERLTGRDPKGRWQLLAATPNWLTNTAEDPQGGGSPGTPPEPVEDEEGERRSGPRNWMFRFEDEPKTLGAGLKSLVAAERALAAAAPSHASNVVVAVLDTCPNAEAVRTHAATQGYAGTAAAPNLWNRVLEGDNRVRMDDAPVLPPDAFDHLLTVVPDWRGVLDLWPDTLTDAERKAHRMERYGIADHGLFVAGIIRDIAPRAQVHLIRVLDDTGVGDLQTIAEELAHLPIRFKDHLAGGGKLIVNLSLTATLPTSDELLRDWFAETHRNVDEMTRRWSDICAALGVLHRSLAELIGWLTDGGILVVAAAGNNSYRTNHHLARHAPALPARYDDVLGVSALDGTGNPATYANRGDEELFGNGVATYGGNAMLWMPGGGTPDVETGVLKIAADGTTRDAVIGIYSTPTMPTITGDSGGATANTTGWAYWAGTSFATPVVAGIAANLWAQPGSPDDPQAIIAAVHDLATVDVQGGDGLACNGIRAWQEAT